MVMECSVDIKVMFVYCKYTLCDVDMIQITVTVASVYKGHHPNIPEYPLSGSLVYKAHLSTETNIPGPLGSLMRQTSFPVQSLLTMLCTVYSIHCTVPLDDGVSVVGVLVV